VVEVVVEKQNEFQLSKSPPPPPPPPPPTFLTREIPYNGCRNNKASWRLMEVVEVDGGGGG